MIWKRISGLPNIACSPVKQLCNTKIIKFAESRKLLFFQFGQTNYRPYAATAGHWEHFVPQCRYFAIPPFIRA